MISERTVLILGAGASKELGNFPTGRELVGDVYEHFEEGISNECQVLNALGYSAMEIQTFRTHLHDARPKSVDALLQTRDDLVDIGKAAMAVILLQKEQSSRNVFKKLKEESWCTHILDQMDAGGFDAFETDSLSVVTFNYDRSFEHLLYTAMMTRHYRHMSHERCEKKIKDIQVIHVYGSLGKLPWQSEGRQTDDVVKYAADTKPKAVKKSARSIKIISELDASVEEDSNIAAARRLITDAKRIYFLGFGYHDTNMKRLQLSSTSRSRARGTSYKLTVKERDEIIRRPFSGSRHALSMHTSYNCLRWLREEVNF